MTLALAVGGLPATRATADPYAVTPSSRSPSAGTLALEWGDWDVQPQAFRGGWVVMQPWEHDQIPELRRQNPRIRILMYKDVSATVSTACVPGPTGRCNRDQEILPAGVGYWRASRRHLEWFLRTSDGRRLEWADYPGLHPMDIANAGYQRAWGHNVLAELRDHDWDGVMMDDTLTRLSHPVVDGATSPQIPDDAAMYDATESFLSAVGARLIGAGFLAVPNLTIYYDNWRSTLQDWTPHVSGWENEYLVKWGLDPGPLFSGNEWWWKLRMLEWAARRQVPVLAVTYSSAADRRAQTYHRATWLLAWNGRDGASMFVPSESGVSFWLRRAIKNVGRPAGPREAVGRPSVQRRPYSRGVVVVNTGGSPRSVPLAGRYLWRGEPVRRVDLRARQAVVLRTVGR